MITPVWIIGFAGHRNLAKTQPILDSIKQALLQLQQQAQSRGGRIEFYSSAAYGADTLAAETAAALGVPVHLILPMPEEEFREDFLTEDNQLRAADWKRSQELIANARSGKNGGTLRLARGTHLRPECYYDAGMQMLEACDAIVAIWDELPSSGLGGTGDVVDQARASRKPLLIISENGELKLERFEKFARADEPGLKLIHELSQLAEKHSTQGETSADTVFLSLDTAANESSRSFRSSLIRSIMFHGLATMIAAFAVILPKGESWSSWTLFGFCLIEMVLVTWALLLSRVQKWRHTHNQWLIARFGAELLRGIRSAIAFADPLSPHALRHVPNWRQFAIGLSLSASKDLDREKGWSSLRDEYIHKRLLNQEKHFVEKQARAASTLRLTHLVGTWATWLAPAFVFLALLYKLDHAIDASIDAEVFNGSELSKDIVFRFMPIFVPLVAGIASGLRTALDTNRRTHRYAELVKQVQQTVDSLRCIKTESSSRRSVLVMEEVLLDELIEWKLAEEQNGGH